MSIQEVSAEQLAELFDHYHQALGPDFGSTSKPKAEAWGRYHNRKRAVWSLLPVWHCWNWTATDRERENPRRYFAKPGEAEWGC